MLGKLFAKKLSFLRDNRGIAPLFILVLVAAAALAIPITTRLVQQPQDLRQHADYEGWPSNEKECADGGRIIRAKIGEKGPVEDCESKGAICVEENDKVLCKPMDKWCHDKGLDNCSSATSNKCRIYRGYKNEEGMPECRPASTLNILCYDPFEYPRHTEFCYSGGEGQICYHNNSKYAFCGSSHLLEDGENCKDTVECKLGSWCSDNKCKICLSGECKDNNVAPTPTPTSAPIPTPTTAPYSCVTTNELKYKCDTTCTNGWTDSARNPNTTCAGTSNPKCCLGTRINSDEPTPTLFPCNDNIGGVEYLCSPLNKCADGWEKYDQPTACSKLQNSPTCCRKLSATGPVGPTATPKPGSPTNPPVRTPTPTPTPFVTEPCPGGFDACGNAYYGYLGICNEGRGYWSYANIYKRDNWCYANAVKPNEYKAYCYTCNIPLSPTPAPTVGAGTPTPTPTPTIGAGIPTPTPTPALYCSDVNPDRSHNACRANSCLAGEIDKGISAGSDCNRYYGGNINKCCQVTNTQNLGPSCLNSDKKCDLNKNQPNGANIDCTGCGGACVDTHVISGFGQCMPI